MYVNFSGPPPGMSPGSCRTSAHLTSTSSPSALPLASSAPLSRLPSEIRSCWHTRSPGSLIHHHMPRVSCPPKLSHCLPSPLLLTGQEPCGGCWSHRTRPASHAPFIHHPSLCLPEVPLTFSSPKQQATLLQKSVHLPPPCGSVNSPGPWTLL